MVTALEEYLQEFDSCKCAPCPNNARPVLSGTECLCVCQTGTYGPNCETRAPDYTSGKGPRIHHVQPHKQESHMGCLYIEITCYSSKDVLRMTIQMFNLLYL